MFDHTIVIQRATALTSSVGTDAVQRDWANAASTTVSRVHVQPVSSDDTLAPGAVTPVARWFLTNEPGAGKLDLLATDRVLYDDKTLEVAGPPRHCPSPDGGWHHTEATLVLQPLTPVGAQGGATGAARTAATGTGLAAWSPL